MGYGDIDLFFFWGLVACIYHGVFSPFFLSFLLFLVFYHIMVLLVSSMQWGVRGRDIYYYIY